MFCPLVKFALLRNFFRAFPGVKGVFIDGTERPVQKPKNLRRRKKMYSGKKR
ncbi:hypothetical protein [Symbiopectobacterium purcellii]|uniref:hypothetical protein n=1 Tax=Symbiopectobacterium purcellii TaxID=2871826 RepID=UPI003F84BF3D